MELSGKAEFSREDQGVYPHWYLGDEAKKKAQAFIGALVKSVRGAKPEILKGKKFNALFTDTLKVTKISENVGQNYVDISKQFIASPFGDFGLSEWPEINPKTARDWAYAVIRNDQKPMHFTEIVSRINQFRKTKIANVQTVHNELIKDQRFVLVGRGIYGLREFGILPGTAREVIAHFLKKHGPMKSSEVVKLVLSERFFKEGTILINLQNKKYFKGLSDGRYEIRTA